RRARDGAHRILSRAHRALQVSAQRGIRRGAPASRNGKARQAGAAPPLPDSVSGFVQVAHEKSLVLLSFERRNFDVASGVQVRGLHTGTERPEKGEAELQRHELVVDLKEEE